MPNTALRYHSSHPVERSFTRVRWQTDTHRFNKSGPIKSLSEPVNFWPIAAVCLAVATFSASFIMGGF